MATTYTFETLPEHPGIREVPGDEIRAKIKDPNLQRFRSAFLHEGDLVLDGDLALSSCRLIVTGSLEVTGSVSTDETATLVVLGNLTCRHLYLEGNLEVQGNATIKSVLYGFYEAGISRVHGTTSARIGLLGNHDWECDDEQFEVAARFDNNRKLHDGDPIQLRAALGDRAFEGLSHMMGLSQTRPPGNAAWGLGLFSDL